MFDDFTIEMARLVRELTQRAEAKVRSQQLGLAFEGLEHSLGGKEGHQQAERHHHVVAV